MTYSVLLSAPAQLVGLIGAAIYIVTYALTAIGRLPSDRPAYFLTKALAASLVLFSLTADYNLASIVIQVFFFAASLYGLSRTARRGDAGNSAATRSTTRIV